MVLNNTPSFFIIYKDLRALEMERFFVNLVIRAFKAMGVNSANLDLGSLGKVALW